MPTYEYLCSACSHRFEQWQHMKDDALTICPVCGGHIRRVFFPAGIVFKGSGFYKTDHGSSTVAAANGNGHTAKGEPTTAETKIGDEKPATSTESAKSSTSTSSENKAPAATTAQ
jgi:putative FmdB family regulatory protein